MKGLSVIVLLLSSLLTLGLVSMRYLGSGRLNAFEAVIVLVGISGLGGIAFLLGRSHARQFRRRSAYVRMHF